MKNWAQGLKQWSIWLVGEGSRPDRRAGLMLGATIAVVVLLGAGTAWAFQNPAPSRAGGARGAEVAAYRAALLHKGRSLHHGSSTTKAHRTHKSTRTTTKASRAAEYRKAVALALANGSHSTSKKPKHTRLKVHHHAKKVKRARTGSGSGSSSAAGVAATTGLAGIPSLASPIIPSIIPAPSGVATPGAPTITGATSGQDGTRVTWSAPTDEGTSPVTGYNLFVGTRPGAQYVTPVNGSKPITSRSYVVAHLTLGTTYYFTVKAVNAVGTSAPSNQLATTPPVDFQAVGSLGAPVVAMASNRAGTGSWLANSSGWVATTGGGRGSGSTAGVQLNAPIIELVATPNGQGYWEVASDGGVFAFNAPFYGSMGGQPLNAPIVGLVATADGAGYWEVARDGGIFAYGDAGFSGSMGGRPLDQPVVGMALDPVTGGYWEVAGNGDVFAFGGAPKLGTPSDSAVNNSVVGIAGAP